MKRARVWTLWGRAIVAALAVAVCTAMPPCACAEVTGGPAHCSSPEETPTLFQSACCCPDLPVLDSQPAAVLSGRLPAVALVVQASVSAVDRGDEVACPQLRAVARHLAPPGLVALRI